MNDIVGPLSLAGYVSSRGEMTAAAAGMAGAVIASN